MATTVQSPPEARVVLHNVSWETYECLLADHASSSSPRFVYDRGELEIVSPLPEHDRNAWAAALVVEAAAEALDLDIYSLDSTTFRRQELQLGFEPDKCFYFANEAAVRGKRRLDLTVDPPPDLVIEADLTRSSIDKLALYAAFGVPEVWRCDAARVAILGLEGDRYVERGESRWLTGVTGMDLSALVLASWETSQRVWVKRVRAWARKLPESTDG
jgi:Uma2 family endonuclease